METKDRFKYLGRSLWYAAGGGMCGMLVAKYGESIGDDFIKYLGFSYSYIMIASGFLTGKDMVDKMINDEVKERGKLEGKVDGSD